MLEKSIPILFFIVVWVSQELISRLLLRKIIFLFMSISLSITDERVISKIYLIRGKKVMLDRDLAAMYHVETRVLNQAVRRNEKRFPPDFMFQLTKQELALWISQNVTSKISNMGLRKLPNVFTEQGVAMLSSVLNSETAIEVNIQIIHIFSRMREVMLTQKDVLLKLEQLERKILKQDERSTRQDADLQMIFKALKQLLNQPSKERVPIGYKTKK